MSTEAVKKVAPPEVFDIWQAEAIPCVGYPQIAVVRLVAALNDHWRKQVEASEARAQRAEQALRESEQQNELLRLRVIDLQQRLEYVPPAVSSTSFITACNCDRHKHGESGGWLCPIHGQQL